MRPLSLILTLLLLTACGTQPPELPTLAVLPTAAETAIRATVTAPAPSATPEPVLPPTFPPTFTPTFTPLPPTPTAAPPTATPTITPRVLPTSVLRSPLDAPENFPIALTVNVNGFSFSANPPSAARYTVTDEGVHIFTAQHTTPAVEQITITLSFADDLSSGDYAATPCAGTGNTLPANTPLCFSATYTDRDLVGVNTTGTVRLSAIDPLAVVVDVPLAITVLPRRNAAARAASVQLTITGQDRTD